GYQPTVKKVVNDRRASLDYEGDVLPTMTKLVDEEFRRGSSIAVEPLKTDAVDIPDRPRLTAVVVGPSLEWTGDPGLRTKVAEWTAGAPAKRRLYPASLVWCFKKPGRDLRDKVELMLAWRRVELEVAAGNLGPEFDRGDRAELRASVKEAEDAARDEVWAGYRYAALADTKEADGVRVIDLGAGHSSSGESLTGRVLAALKSEALLSDTVAPGYIERNWPPPFVETGAWPLGGLRRAFLDGSLTRLVDADAVLRAKVPDFILRGEFGLGSRGPGTSDFQRVWFKEPVAAEELAFDDSVFLLGKAVAERLTRAIPPSPDDTPALPPPVPAPAREHTTPAAPRIIRVAGRVPPEIWNRLGTRLLPKIRGGSDVQIRVELAATFPGEAAADALRDLNQALEDLGIGRDVRVTDGE
ncbi:MAG: DUF499 domain-containing protein, partial [Acidobacteriota bacterium]